MANTITVGRMTFTSPRTINENSVQTGNRNSLDREISISGSLCGSGDGARFYC